jgi:hypothetical protein
MRTRLNDLKRQVAKLRKTGAPEGTGAGWLLVFKLDDTITGVHALLNRHARSGSVSRDTAALMVFTAEARRLGVIDRPDVKAALGELSALLAAARPPAGMTWAELSAARSAATVDAASLILKAQGVPDGPLGSLPLGGRPAPEPVAAWLAEVVRVSQHEPPRPMPSPSTPTAPPSPLGPLSPTSPVAPDGPWR